MKNIFIFIFCTLSFIAKSQTDSTVVMANQMAFATDWHSKISDFNAQRHAIIIPKKIQKDLQVLKTAYEIRLLVLKNNPENLPKTLAYTAYPDLAAVLLNRGEQFPEKVSEEEKTKINNLTTDIWKKIPHALYNQLSDITDKLNREKFHLVFPYKFDNYRIFFDDTPRKKNDVLNFLIWNP